MLLAPALFAATALSDVRELRAMRTLDPPVVDGQLDDAAWQQAPETDAFTQKFPNEGDAPSERTIVRVLYDDRAVYVGVDCRQTRVPVVARLTRRDRDVEADWVSFGIGTRGDGKTAFDFVVNAAGVLTDGIHFNDTEYSTDWDENWEARTWVTAKGWSAELRIPLRILRFESRPVQAWNFQVRRYISMLHETDEWAYIPRSGAGEVSRWGKLGNLVGLPATMPLELRPFVVGRVRRRDAATTQVKSGTDETASAGMDLKWHPTQALTLDATLNPDFAQVEADEAVLNLTTFETYYPEKRPFFLEGIDTFATPQQLLYTRRIGRAALSPTLRLDPPFEERLVDVPEPATIYGASKLTGRLADRWTIGTVQAVTARSDVQVLLADGTRQERLIEPLTAFNVLRLKREIADNGHIGAMLTATTHAEPTTVHPLLEPSPTDPTHSRQLCPDGTETAAFSRCFNNAYVGSLDWRWRSPGGDYATGGQVTGTVLSQGPPRTVPDGTVIRPGDAGAGVAVFANKEGGKHWVGGVSLEYLGRKLDYNDLGYSERSNLYGWSTNLEYRELEHWHGLLESHARLEYGSQRAIDGLHLESHYQASISGKLKSFWEFWIELQFRPAHFDDREVGDGTALERDGLVGYEVAIASDRTKPVGFWIWTMTQRLFDGFNVHGESGVQFRLLPQLDLEIAPNANYTTGEPRFAEQGTLPGEYLFGRLQAKSVAATLRATYTFAPALTLQTYAQLFLASGHYSSLSSYLSDPSGPRPVVRLADLTPYDGSPPTNPDFQQGLLNVSVVLRWEYRLGSTLFIVYSRSQAPEITLLAGETGSLTWRSLGRAPAADVVVAKLSYWWG